MFVRAVLLTMLAAMFFGGSTLAAGQKEWIVHSFDGTHGDQPMGNLVADSAGNLYGTAYQGGAHNWGTVYELVRPVPPKTAWTETVLHTFSGGVDGGLPEGGVIFDGAGNLYGTTYGGGASNAGTVFKLTPPVFPGGAWTQSVLHSFQPVSGDGEYPETGLTWDHSGDLIGVTPSGGSNRRSACGGDCGTVFQLSPPSAPGGTWTETILQNFKWGQGVVPRGTPVVAANGILYGTTYIGGLNGEGVIYRLTPPAVPGGTWTYRVLHSFTGHADGGSPRGSLVLHGKGVLYGATGGGGANGGGTVFEFFPPAVAGGAWTENVIYSFGSFSGDGSGPASNVIFDSAGNIYGTTPTGGANPTSCSVLGCGSVFQLTPPIAGDTWTETILHSFSGSPSDGARPTGGLLLEKNGVLFGVTQWGGSKGGANGEGTVYGVVQ
jgi:uncharacterized repeat protein (TIGR03803 family)